MSRGNLKVGAAHSLSSSSNSRSTRASEASAVFEAQDRFRKALSRQPGKPFRINRFGQLEPNRKTLYGQRLAQELPSLRTQWKLAARQYELKGDQRVMWLRAMESRWLEDNHPQYAALRHAWERLRLASRAAKRNSDLASEARRMARQDEERLRQQERAPEPGALSGLLGAA